MIDSMFPDTLDANECMEQVNRFVPSIIKMLKISPVKKNVYEEHPNVAQRSADEVNKFLEENQVTIEGKKVHDPF